MNKQKYDEKILVVPRKHIFNGATLTGFSPMSSFASWQSIIEQHKQFLPRGDMEQNCSYKQIIPYLIFTHNNKYFLMQRKASASEQRLQSKKSLGIGGHIREEDLIEEFLINNFSRQESKLCRVVKGDQDKWSDILGWAKREFYEEVSYSGTFDIEPLGIINDESSDVGKVHIGFAFLIKGNSSSIAVRSELKSGELLTLEQCAQHYDELETWSQFVFNYLHKREQ